MRKNKPANPIIEERRVIFGGIEQAITVIDAFVNCNDCSFCPMNVPGWECRYIADCALDYVREFCGMR